MTAPRRRIIRRPASRPSANPQRLQKARSRLEQQRAALVGWTARLKRAFHSVERLQRSVSRIEKQIKTLEGS